MPADNPLSPASAREISPPGAPPVVDIESIEETAYSLDPKSDEEAILAFQFAFTNRAGMAVLADSFPPRAEGKLDHRGIATAAKLLNLSLRQLSALNAQRALRALRMKHAARLKAPARAPKRSAKR
jgi:hypothetical protein